jgi:hypothetical protein
LTRYIIGIDPERFEVNEHTQVFIIESSCTKFGYREQPMAWTIATRLVLIPERMKNHAIVAPIGRPNNACTGSFPATTSAITTIPTVLCDILVDVTLVFTSASHFAASL